MDIGVQQFIAKSLKSLQKQIDGQEKTIKSLEKRIRRLEPPVPDEMILQNAQGNLDLYLIRDEEGNYIEYRTDTTEL